MDADSPEQQKGTESLMRGNTLSAQQFYRHDPLLVLLKDRLHLNDLWISTSVMVLPGSVFLCWWLWWASKAQEWHPENMLSVLLQIFVLFPVLFLIYLSVPGSIAVLFNTLKANGVIGEHRRHQPGAEAYEAFIQQLIFWMNRSWWTAAILVVVICYAFYRLVLLEPASLSPVPYWMRVCAIISYLPLMYATGMSVLRLLLALVFTNRLFYLFTLQVQPLHPDGSGGLGVLGRLLWHSVSIMLWEALLLVASVLSRNLLWLSLSEMILLAAIYITLTPALLIGWLIFPHQMMVRARNEALQPLAAEYQRTLVQSLLSGDADTRSVVAETRRLEALKQRYDLIRASFPTWPLETSALSRIGVTLILPIILPLITSLISLALRVPGIP